MEIETAFPFMALAFAGAGILWAHFSGKALDRKIEAERKNRTSD